LLIKAKNLVKSYKSEGVSHRIVDQVNFSMKHGEFVIVKGVSGSGKTTLLNLLAGILTPTDGEVYFEGSDITKMNDRQLSQMRNQRVSYIPQNDTLLKTLTLWDNLHLPFFLGKGGEITGDQLDEKLTELLKEFGLWDRRNAYPSELSGGEMRRALIIRAMALDPELILADEPTASLDPDTTLSVMEKFRTVSNRGIAVLLVSHQPQTYSYGDRLYEMKDGKLRPAKEHR
jgi:putative ABC transport system ATP-binding protein